jgi:hypothetical protein
MGLRNQLDGYRAVAIKYCDSIDLFSRRHKSFISQDPYIVEALRDLPEGMLARKHLFVGVPEKGILGEQNQSLATQGRSEVSGQPRPSGDVYTTRAQVNGRCDSSPW